MTARQAFALLGLLCLLFVIANRGAYKSYFSADDLDNLVWTRDAQPSVFWQGLVSPRLAENNFRPAGHGLYRWMGGTFGLNFPAHIATIHGLHILNLLLLWLLLRRLDAPPLAAMAGILFFGFHMALFDNFWKPMFLFDVLLTTFALLTLLLYLHGQWIAALLPFWLAYKSKELAVTLPLMLAAYEGLLGNRRWKRLLPFFGISAMFSVQAMLQNRGREDAYTLRFTFDALVTCVRFYFPRLAVVLPALWFFRDRRIQFGILSLALLPLPLFFLPGRLFSAYLYLPLLGGAIAIAFAAARLPHRWLAAAAMVWILGNLFVLRRERRRELTLAPQHRAFVTSIGNAVAQHPATTRMFLDESPLTFERWGAEAAFRWFRPGVAVEFSHMDDPQRQDFVDKPPYLASVWDRRAHQLLTLERTGEEPDAAYIDMVKPTPVWQLLEGWQNMEGGFRWSLATARARLARPPAADRFALRLNAGTEQLRDQGRLAVELLLDGQSLGIQTLTQTGWLTLEWPLPPTAAPASVVAEIRNTQPYRPTNGDPRILGVAVAELGFVGIRK